MNKIEILGVIVNSNYDVDFMYPYIKKGIITPLSYLKKQLSNADNKKDLTLYINSPGGSVFAGNEMINMLIDWKIENKRKINVVIGAMAASMGSAIMISVSDTVKVHSNSKIMFHGAFGEAVGGSEAMKDYSELLEKINNDIKLKLITQYNLKLEIVDEWFKEGREGWLNADEAIKCGMAESIIGEKAVLPESADNIDNMLNERGMKLAALTLQKYKQKDSKMEKLMNVIKQLFASKISEDELENIFNETETETQETVENTEETESKTETNEEVEAETVENTETETDEAENLEDINDELKTQCIAFEDKIKNLNDALNKKQSENDKVKADINKLTIKCEKLLGGGMNFEIEEDQPNDWKSCLKKCDGDYVKARKTYPDIYAKFMK